MTTSDALPTATSGLPAGPNPPGPNPPGSAPDGSATGPPPGASSGALSPAHAGSHGEVLAADHLRNLGLEVVARNWRIAAADLRGELDLVALDHREGVVVIVEVKTRRGQGFGGPLAAVDRRKQAQLRRLAMAFMARASLPYREVRFDVIGVRLDTRHLHHVVDAL